MLSYCKHSYSTSFFHSNSVCDIYEYTIFLFSCSPIDRHFKLFLSLAITINAARNVLINGFLCTAARTLLGYMCKSIFSSHSYCQVTLTTRFRDASPSRLASLEKPVACQGTFSRTMRWLPPWPRIESLYQGFEITGNVSKALDTAIDILVRQ